MSQQRNSFHVKPLQNGVLLVELLITTALMSIALAALAKFQVALIQDIHLTKSKTVAMNFAINKLETLRAYGDINEFTAITSGSETIKPSGPDVIPGLDNPYTLSWAVTTGGQMNHSVLNITVTWPDRNGNITSDTTLILSTEISYSSPYQNGRLYL